MKMVSVRMVLPKMHFYITIINSVRPVFSLVLQRLYSLYTYKMRGPIHFSNLVVKFADDMTVNITVNILLLILVLNCIVFLLN